MTATRPMKTIVAREGQLIHVETPLGIVNIRTGLHDADGNRVDSIEILANNYAGEPPVTLDGYVNSRLIEGQTP